MFSRLGFAQLAGKIASGIIGLSVMLPMTRRDCLERVAQAVGPSGVIFLIYTAKIGYLFVFWLLVPNLPKDGWTRTKMRFADLFRVFAMMYAVSTLFDLAGKAISRAAPVGGTMELDTLNSLVTSKIPMGILIPVVFGPILEELIFRKLMIDRIHRYGEKTAIVFSAVCFGLYHGNLTQFLFAASIGLFLGYVYCKTEKTAYTVLMHMLLNGLSSFILLLVPLVERENPAAVIVLLLAAAGIVFLTVSGAVFTIRYIRNKALRPDHAVSAAARVKEVYRTVYLNPGVMMHHIFCMSGILAGLLNLKLPFAG